MKKIILCTSLVLISLLLNSCRITQEGVWGSNIQTIDKDEILKDLLINLEGTKLILVGVKYDYFISDEEKKIKKISDWNKKEILQSSFSIAASGKKVEVGISFIVPNTLVNSEQQNFLRSFRNSKFEKKYDKKFGTDNKMLSFRVNLVGIRTKIDSTQDFSKKYDGFFSTKLIKNGYKVELVEHHTPSQTFGKILLTPFAVAADIIIAPFYLVTSMYVAIVEHHKAFYASSSNKKNERELTIFNINN